MLGFKGFCWGVTKCFMWSCDRVGLACVEFGKWIGDLDKNHTFQPSPTPPPPPPPKKKKRSYDQASVKRKTNKSPEP